VAETCRRKKYFFQWLAVELVCVRTIIFLIEYFFEIVSLYNSLTPYITGFTVKRHEFLYLDLGVMSDVVRSEDEPSDSGDVLSQEGRRTRAACAVRDIGAPVAMPFASNQQQTLTYISECF
jgi:hypothetical protein